MRGIRLVASDLDGTLLLPDETISERTRAALAAAKEAGITVVLVSGRQPRSLGPIAERIGADALLAEACIISGISLCMDDDDTGLDRVRRGVALATHIGDDRLVVAVVPEGAPEHLAPDAAHPLARRVAAALPGLIDHGALPDLVVAIGALPRRGRMRKPDRPALVALVAPLVD